jgi:Ca2+-binding RTX toxin-like protein
VGKRWGEAKADHETTRNWLTLFGFPVGETGSLTTGTDTFIGSVGNDTITGTSATLQAGDTIIDQSATDHDTLNLTLTAQNAAARISGVENVNVDWNAFGDASFDATNVTGATVTLSSAKVGYLGNATVTGAGANTIVAGSGMKGNLVVNGVTGATVDAGAAKTVTVNGTVATNDSATVTAGAATTTVTVAGVESVTATAGAATTNVSVTGYNTATIDAGTAATITLTDDAATDAATVKVAADATVNTGASTGKLTLDIADGKTVTLGNIGADVTVTGAGDVTLKSADLSGNKVLDTKTSGTLTVESSVAGALDLDEVNADLIKLATAGATVATVKSGANVQVAADLAVGGLTVAAAGTADSVNATYTASQGTSTTFTGIETVNLVAAAAQAAGAATATDLTFASLVNAGNTINLSGANDVAITSLTAKVLDASQLNGVLAATTAAAATDVTVAGGQGNSTVTFDSAATNAAFVGQAGVDTVTFGTLGNAATATAVTGAGNDVITANVSTLTTGALSVEAGAGNDIVNLNGAVAATTGTVVLQFGDGNDTLKLDAAANLTGANLTITGLEKLVINGSATFDADQLSGKTLTVEGTTANAVDTLVVNGTVVAGETINLSGLTGTDSVSTGIQGAVVTGNTGTDVIIGTNRADVIDGGAGKDQLTGGAGADKFVIDSDGAATASVADVVTDFSASAGDTLSFGNAAGNGAVGNYFEGTTAVASFADAMAAANTALTGAGIAYVAEQVGSDTYVFSGAAGSGVADNVVQLVGVDLAQIDYSAIVA